MTSNIIQRDNMILSLDEFLAPIAGLHSQWKLCYRASSHGWAASTFHSRCDGKVNTITVIRKLRTCLEDTPTFLGVRR